jgi:hypothetical protein
MQRSWWARAKTKKENHMRSMLTMAATAVVLAAAPAVAAPASHGDALKAAANSVSPVENTQFYFGFGGPGFGYGPGYGRGYGYGYRPYYRPHYGYGYGSSYRRYRPYRYY